MSNEGHKRGKELATPLPSLRDYWDNPTGFPVSPPFPPPQGNRKREHVITPSLWDTHPVQRQFGSLEPSEEESLQTPPASLSLTQATHIAEAAVLPLSVETSLDRTKHLAGRIEQHGVSALSTGELLTVILQTKAG